MTDQQIQQLINSDFFVKEYGLVKLVDTHISWVLLAQDFVFKIKKPHHYSFLDFSSLEKRKYFCERELNLNQRLAPAIYLAVVPVVEEGGVFFVEKEKGTIVDYAVKMSRMDEKRQMNLLIKQGAVGKKHLDFIAQQLAVFHKKAEKIKKAPTKKAMQADFNDILIINDYVQKIGGTEKKNIIETAVVFSDDFLKHYFQRILERHNKGFYIDGHGDLYSQNIFLPKKYRPVIFDCIEFSDHLRQLDVLNELAFFCMDLEYYGEKELANYFLKKYNDENPCIFNQEDINLFNYFKLYRANVRAKVGALKAMQMEQGEQLKKQIDFVNDYLKLMEIYLKEMTEPLKVAGSRQVSS
ncbi:MAG: hypothetical protein AAFZ15_07385 [Bacteroidota bacterium]